VYIFEITTPGTWLDYPDRDWAWKIEGLLQNLQAQFYEANTALNLFEQAQIQQLSRTTREQWQADSDRRSQIRGEIEAELDFDFSPLSWDRISHEAEVRFKREKWGSGKVPREFERSVIPIYARAFLYAVDGFDKFLAVLKDEPGTPPKISELSARFESMFPDLRGVRNTAQHLEDRSRGLGAGKNPKLMALQPVENRLVSAPGGGVLVLNSLNGNRFGCTMSDGHYGEVEISAQALQLLSTHLHEVLQCFQWKGSVQHAPSA
jgi:hypothetical protein